MAEGTWGTNATMRCVVTNQTGSLITNFGVSHVWGDLSNSPNPNPIAALPPNGTVSMAINVGPGNNDYWSVMFTAIDCWYRNMLQCDLSEDDFNSGQPVNVYLLNGSDGWNIEPPVSPASKNNYYESCD